MRLLAKANFYCNRQPKACAQWSQEVFRRGLQMKNKGKPKNEPRIRPKKTKKQSKRSAAMTEAEKNQWETNIRDNGAALWPKGTPLDQKAITCWKVLKKRIDKPFKLHKKHLRYKMKIPKKNEVILPKEGMNDDIKDHVNCLMTLPDAERIIQTQRRQDWLHSMWQKVYKVADRKLDASPEESGPDALTRIARAVDRYFFKGTIKEFIKVLKIELSFSFTERVVGREQNGGIRAGIVPNREEKIILLPGWLQDYGHYPNHHDRSISVVVSSWKHHICHHIGVQLLAFARYMFGYREDDRDNTHFILCNEWVYGHRAFKEQATTPARQVQPRRREVA